MLVVHIGPPLPQKHNSSKEWTVGRKELQDGGIGLDWRFSLPPPPPPHLRHTDRRG